MDMDSNTDEKPAKPIPFCLDDGNRHSGFSFPLSCCLYFLTGTTMLEIFRARRHPSAVVCIIAFYVCFMSMIVCIHFFHRFPEDSKKRKRLKGPILILATAVNVLFVHGVSVCVPLFMAAVMWGVVGSTFVIGCCFLFVYPHKNGGKDEPAGDGSLMTAAEV